MNTNKRKTENAKTENAQIENMRTDNEQTDPAKTGNGETDNRTPNNRKINNDLTKGEILPGLVRFTAPILIGDLFQQLYNIVDTIIVGRTLGANALAAVGATGTIMFLMIGSASALANGFAVVTAQKFGAKDEEKVHQSFASSVLLIFLIGLAATILELAVIRRVLILMNTPENIFADSLAYISTICAGLLCTIFYNLLAASLRAVGNSRIPLYFLIFSSVMNIFFDLFFIIGLHLGVRGAALATLLGQLISALLCAVYIVRKEKILVPVGKEWKPVSDIVKEQLYIGIPMALQNCITASGTMVMQTATNGFGSTAVAAITATDKCRMIFTQTMMSTGTGMATFCGQNYGNRDMKRVKDGVWSVVKLFLVYSAAIIVILCVFLPLELRLFFTGSENLAELLPYAKIYIQEASIGLIPLSWIFIFRNSMQGYGKSFLAMSAGFVELGTRLILAFLAIHTMSFRIACLCNPGAWMTGGIYTMICFILSSRRLERKMKAAVQN